MGILPLVEGFPDAERFCPRRTGRLPSGGSAFFAKESGGKESAEGALPPLHSPQCASRLKACCGGISQVRCHLNQAFCL